MLLRKMQSIVSARCPVCGYREGSRARRRPLDRWAGLLRIYRFECRACNVQFHAFALKPSASQSAKQPRACRANGRYRGAVVEGARGRGAVNWPFFPYTVNCAGASPPVRRKTCQKSLML